MPQQTMPRSGMSSGLIDAAHVDVMQGCRAFSCRLGVLAVMKTVLVSAIIHFVGLRLSRRPLFQWVDSDRGPGLGMDCKGAGACLRPRLAYSPTPRGLSGLQSGQFLQEGQVLWSPSTLRT